MFAFDTVKSAKGRPVSAAVASAKAGKRKPETMAGLPVWPLIRSRKNLYGVLKAEIISPEELAACAARFKSHGNIGLAFTYNEPLIGYEFVRDTAKLIHQSGMQNVLVTNGTVELPILDELAPWIDAMNIDLKGFSEHYYKDVLGGNLGMVKAFISKAVQFCHVELTTLIVPGENDSAEEMRELSRWVAGLRDANGTVIGRDIPLHISRFFPRFHMVDRSPTDVSLIYILAEIARENLKFVYTGNC